MLDRKVTIHVVLSEGLIVSELFAQQLLFSWLAMASEISISSHFFRFSHQRPCEKSGATLKRHIYA